MSASSPDQKNYMKKLELFVLTLPEVNPGDSLAHMLVETVR
jgi:hypothetical protein